MTKRSRSKANEYRIVLAVVLILIVASAAGYEYYQQQPQQEAISILKQYGEYDPNYNYVMFGSLDTNSILSAANPHTHTRTRTVTSLPSPTPTRSIIQPQRVSSLLALWLRIPKASTSRTHLRMRVIPVNLPR